MAPTNLFSSIKARLLEAGHVETDIAALRYEQEEKSSTKSLTDAGKILKSSSSFECLTYRGSVWKRLKPSLEKRINVLKNKRIAEAMISLKQKRRAIAKRVYQDYAAASYRPAQWAVLPGISEVMAHEDVKAVIDAPVLDDEADSLQFSENEFARVKAKLPDIISACLERRRAELLGQIDIPLSLISEALMNANGLDIAEMQRSFAVFLCAQVTVCQNAGSPKSTGPVAKTGIFGPGLPLIGVDSGLMHVCEKTAYSWNRGIRSTENPLSSKVKFSLRGTRAALSLTRYAMPMGIASIAPANLDTADLRFVCLSCRLHLERPNWVRKAMSWRQCVSVTLDKC